MKKVGIVTFHRANNYGACLQGYALQRELNLLGYDAEYIDYFPVRKNILRKLFSPLHIYYYLRGKKRALKNDAFRDFRKILTKQSPRFQRPEDLKKADYFAYITGSDQVWNPHHSKLDPYFWLNFAPQTKTISYAASFGIASIPAEHAAFYRQNLSSIRFLSVRESSGAKIIQDLTGRTPSLVFDPTLLLSPQEWDSTLEKFPATTLDGPYILCYGIKYLEDITAVARSLSEKMGGIPLVMVGSNQTDRQFCEQNKIRCLIDVSPIDFVSLIKNAAGVVTNSFHGTAFSLIYRKNFWTVRRFNPKLKDAANTRMTDLLGRLDLESRFVDPQRAAEQVDPSLPYPDGFDAFWTQCQKESIAFLQNALNQIQEDSL